MSVAQINVLPSSNCLNIRHIRQIHAIKIYLLEPLVVLIPELSTNRNPNRLHQNALVILARFWDVNHS